MTWRLAKSLEQLRQQVNDSAPGRSTISDGSIGDTAHSNRTSDHNPWCGPGVVTAIDITDDPSAGADMKGLTESLRLSQDPRIKYVIFSGRMFSSYPTSSTPAWTWRPYTGINAHAHHAHISVQCDVSKDSMRPWDIEGKEWDEMATKAEVKDAVREVVREEVKKAIVDLAVGTEQKGYDPDKVNLKAILKEVQK